MARARVSFLHSRWPAYGLGLGVIAATALPASWPAHLDSYPLSTYPMFARPLERPLVYFVERVDDRRGAVRLGPEEIGSDEVMQSFKAVRGAVDKGPEAVMRLCRSIAARLAQKDKKRRPVSIRIVGARFDPVSYFTVGQEPEERTVEASCKMRRPR